MSYRSLVFGVPLLSLTLAACDSGTTPPPGDDAGPSGCTAMTAPEIVWSHAAVGVTPGTSRDVFVGLRRDHCADVSIEVTAEGAGAVDFEATHPIPAQTSQSRVRVTGRTAGPVTLHARYSTAGAPMRDATIEIVVVEPSAPTCSGDPATGRVIPGGAAVRGAGAVLSRAAVSVVEAASGGQFPVAPFDVEIACAEDQIPDGYIALGPAISLSSATTYRFMREIDMELPLSLALLPSLANRGHVEIAYTGPGVSEPRIVPITNPVFTGDPDEATLRFMAPRLGTYQAVVREGERTTRARDFTYRGITGFSMGGSGSGRIGVGNPDRFDFVAPLGGPTDWIYLLEYIRRYHIGGFCTEAERMGGEPGCDAASIDHTPESIQLFEHQQTFESWFYEDAYDGQGGTFNREDYISIFRDLSAMFGNPNTSTSTDGSAPDVAPPGVPDALRSMTDEARCMPDAQVFVAPFDGTAGDWDSGTDGRGWFDEEYNPEGQYAVGTFCDGQEPADDDGSDVARWDASRPEAGRVPVEVALFVDRDGDRMRDPGEPVIRNGREPFEDLGADGLASADEAGFEALTNPDPAGDDYDYQYNPTGAEGNWDFDEGERFSDVGIDGVMGTRQVGAGGFDFGEGNGRFDRTAGAARMIASSPRGAIREYDDATLDRFDLFVDGGVRDLFNWAVMGNHTMGAWAARGRPVRFYNGHASLRMDGSDAGFLFNETPWAEIGRHVMVRYGSIDASESDKISGDGGHVGTPTQLIDRLVSAIGMMSARWPGGDRRRVSDVICMTEGPACPNPNAFVLDFEASTGRRGPVSVILPPGYFAPENAGVDYPVVYFLHGYGQTPEDLRAIGVILWNFMVSATIPEAQRVQKMIFVFPDGRCRNDECLRGTFYTDAPDTTPRGAQMQTFLLDLMEYMDENYRTRDAETVDVLE